MPGSWLLLQSALEIPEPERLRRAFRSVRCLTEMDAVPLSKDAYGILVKGLNDQEAVTLQAALAAEGVATDVVAQSQLPEIPPTKFVRQLELADEALIIFDPLGRRLPVPWCSLMILAGGSVQRIQSQTRRQTRMPASWEPRSGQGSEVEPVVEYVSREIQQAELCLELVLERAVARFTLVLEAPPIFGCLGDRRTASMPENYERLARELAHRCPQAAVNRGVWHAREETGMLFAYPSRNAYQEELIWLLWQIRKAGEQGIR